MADSPTVCPFCNDSILIPEEFFGSEVECPTCHKQFLIPKITEEESVEDLNSNEVGTFDCPTCGKTNVLPKSFTGKFQCQGCQKEIEVINDDTISCPHCGKSISKKDTTCMFCQRAINEPPTPAPAPTEVQAEPQPENTPAAVSEIGLQISSTAPVTHGDEEDEEVLHIITKLKSINLIACFIILLISISTSTFWIINKNFSEAGTYMYVILITTLWTIIFHLLLSWFRGVYKNIVRIRIALEKKSGL